MKVTLSDRAEAVHALHNELYAIADEQLRLAKEMSTLMQRQYVLAQRSSGVSSAINKLLGAIHGQET